jgi:hypothetical protein
MGTSLSEIKTWFESGVNLGCTHMIVVCDTFDYEDYPVYVHSDENAREEVSKRDGKEMQKVMEVYNLTKPFPKGSDRVFDY